MTISTRSPYILLSVMECLQAKCCYSWVYFFCTLVFVGLCFSSIILVHRNVIDYIEFFHFFFFLNDVSFLSLVKIFRIQRKHQCFKYYNYHGTHNTPIYNYSAIGNLFMNVWIWRPMVQVELEVSYGHL